MSIKIDDHTDAFTLHVYNSIDEKVRASFTPTQVHAIETAIRANKPFQKHPVDVRGVVPLFFARFYFVFLMGRDRRQKVKRKEASRRKESAVTSAVISVYILCGLVLPVIAGLLYLLKSFVGVDLFPEEHLGEMLSMAREAHALLFAG